MSTLLVSGGHVVSEVNFRRADVLVSDGVVIDVLDPGHGRTCDENVDASGLYVLPGLVDAHVHFNEPGRTEWEGFVTGSSAAAAGGVTTVLDMPLNCHPPTLDGRALALKRAALARRSIVDFGLWGGVVPDSLEHLAELQRAGVVGVKAFLCDSGLAEYPPLDEFTLLEAMQRCAELGLLLALHAEDHALTHRLGSLAREAGRSEALDWARSRPPETEVEAVQRALEMAVETGAKLHFVHISTAAAAKLVAEARVAGADVSLETCPHYLALTEDDLETLGPIAKCAPPLRSSDEQAALWQALCDGRVDFVASDHSPCPPQLKASDSIWTAWGGISGVQTLLPVLLSEGVHRRGFSLEMVVRLTSAAPARRCGLFPRKGSLAPGCDADLVVVDLDREWTLRSQDLRTRWPISPFVGRSFRGAVVATVVRGRVVYRDGRVLDAVGFGSEVHTDE